MISNPEEWQREILLKDFADYVTWSDVVSLEQSLIGASARTIGWAKMWNGGVYRGQIKLASGKGNDALRKYATNRTPEHQQKLNDAFRKYATNRTPEHQQKLNDASKQPRTKGYKRKPVSKELQDARIIQCKKNAAARAGIPLSEERKEQLSNTRWVTNGVDSKQLKYLPEGWRYGRTLSPSTLERMVRPSKVKGI